MNNQPRLSSAALWKNHERICLNLLQEALSTLVDEPTDEKETDLNRSLFRAIIRASYEAERRGEHIPMVVLEGRNPPDLSDLERAERESKIPDLYWGYIDPLAADPNEAAKYFVVECKRLTEPRAWYTTEYVKSGIVRFVTVGHGYGRARLVEQWWGTCKVSIWTMLWIELIQLPRTTQFRYWFCESRMVRQQQNFTTSWLGRSKSRHSISHTYGVGLDQSQIPSMQSGRGTIGRWARSVCD